MKCVQTNRVAGDCDSYVSSALNKLSYEGVVKSVFHIVKAYELQDGRRYKDSESH